MNGSTLSVTEQGVTYPKGFRASGVASGIKRSLRPDLALLVSDREASAAGVFTTNRIRAAPVLLTEEILARQGGMSRGVVVVSGVANALTGPEGYADSARVIELAEQALGASHGSLLHAATGVIGPRIPLPAIERHIGAAVEALAPTREGGFRAASAILTTDTTTKEAAVAVKLADGTRVRVAGMAKGSGMIAPSLAPPHATTLAFLSTDAKVDSEDLQTVLNQEADRTFNMVSVDGDTSTNDTVLLFANGAAGGCSAGKDPAFVRAVGAVLEQLAKAVARDGEGATKMLTVHVAGAEDAAEARSAAKAIARSVLVKTALFGADPNVGRIACALGYSGARFDASRLRVDLREKGNRWPLIQNGTPVPGLDNGMGHRLHALLRRMDEVVLEVELGKGVADATAWGCDLSYGYVHINAHYRT